VSGVAGPIGGVAIDDEKWRALVADPGGNRILTFDLKSHKTLPPIVGRGKGHPTGLALKQAAHQLFVTCPATGTCEWLDSRSYARLATVPDFPGANRVGFEPDGANVYVAYPGGALGIFDTGFGRRLGQIPLDGTPEGFVLETRGSRIFAALPRIGMLQVVNRQSRYVEDTWRLRGVTGCRTVALDEKNHRLLVGCIQPPCVLVLNTANGKKLSSTSVPPDIGELIYDPEAKRAYAICGSGKVAVLRQDTPDRYRQEYVLNTGPGARTAAFSSRVRRLCVAGPPHAGRPARLHVFESSRVR
jgi:DNA-binding beta-propeller fold protein YncE